MDLFSEMMRLFELCDQRIEEMRLAGFQFTENKAAYRIKVREKTLIERAAGTPVTIISDLVRGDPEVTELCIKRDTAETAYKSYIDEININKLRIRVLKEQLAREWGQALQEGSY